ncbi:hypothetical protein WG907_06165 [Sphingobium sp. AN558]|uniref:DUF5983 family protein n=1 Tax=Sphingobium sp. AN558 TaxID=3133442 RepID=UPI0030BB0FB8
MSRLPEPPAEPVPPRRSPLEIGTYLVLSTAHITLKSSERLNSWAASPPELQPIIIASTCYGWFISSFEVEGEAAQAVPVEIVAIQSFARSLGCQYILLDCDGDVVADLPTFSW